MRFPIAGVRVPRPAGFIEAERFEGFQQPSTQSSVLVSALPAPFAELSRGFNAEQMKGRGMTLLQKQRLNIEDQPALLLHVEQDAYGISFEKWIVLFGSEDRSVMVTATYQASSRDTLSDHLKEIVLSARTGGEPVAPAEVEAGFTLTPSRKLKPTHVPGKMLAYSKGGVSRAKSPTDPILIAAPSVSSVVVDDREDFAVRRLYQTAETRILSVSAPVRVRIDGLDGYEVVADAEDVDSLTPLKVYQVMLFDEHSYFLIQGLVGADSADEFLPEFKAMAHSFARTSL